MTHVVCAAVLPNWKIIESPYPARDTFVSPFSVRDFGAKGDGKTDDTVAFQRGLDRTRAIGGGSLYVPAGSYVIRGTLRVPTSVTLRGVWQNPSANGGKAVGSILMLYAGRGNAQGKATIGLDQCSGLREMTLWYPEQMPESITAYPFALEQLGGNNATIENVTFVNAYQGVKIGPGVNELHFLRHVYGTPLKVGLWYDSTTDVGRLNRIHFSPDYWSKSGLPGAPALTGPHCDWIMKHGTGLHMGRSDWEYGSFVHVERYKIGMLITGGERGTPNAQFYAFNFDGCGTGVRIANSNPFGLAFTRSTFRCVDRAIHLEPTFKSVLQLNHCTLSGRELILHEGQGVLSLQSCNLTAGPIDIRQGSMTAVDCSGNPEFRLGAGFPAGVLLGNRFKSDPQIVGPGARMMTVDDAAIDIRPLPAFPELKLPALKPKANNLFVVKASADKDATAAIQRALDEAKHQGGGIVFLPGGDYIIQGSITVPGGVEIKGVYDVPHHTVGGGSMLHIYGGRGDADATPAFTLQAGSGMSGLTFNYPEQVVSSIVPYPFLIRGNGRDLYIVNVTCSSAYQYVDLSASRCDNHYIDYLAGAPLKTGVKVGAGSRDGIIENLHFNPHFWNRTPSGRFWENKSDGDMWKGTGKILWEYQKNHLDALALGHCYNQVLLQNFVFGSLYGIHFFQEESGASEGGFILGHGTDGSKTSAYFEAVGKGGLHMINSKLVCMATRDKEYIVCSKNVEGEIVLHNTLLWGLPDRTGTVEGGHLILQQANFTRHGGGFRLTGGALSLLNCNYMRQCRATESHVTMESDARVEISACNFPGPLKVDGKLVLEQSRSPGVGIGPNAHRKPDSWQESIVVPEFERIYDKFLRSR